MTTPSLIWTRALVWADDDEQNRRHDRLVRAVAIAFTFALGMLAVVGGYVWPMLTLFDSASHSVRGFDELGCYRADDTLDHRAVQLDCR